MSFEDYMYMYRAPYHYTMNAENLVILAQTGDRKFGQFRVPVSMTDTYM